MDNLPDGWVKKWSSSKNKAYYYNKKAKLTQWQDPRSTVKDVVREYTETSSKHESRSSKRKSSTRERGRTTASLTPSAARDKGGRSVKSSTSVTSGSHASPLSATSKDKVVYLRKSSTSAAFGAHASLTPPKSKSKAVSSSSSFSFKWIDSPRKSSASATSRNPASLAPVAKNKLDSASKLSTSVATYGTHASLTRSAVKNKVDSASKSATSATPPTRAFPIPLSNSKRKIDNPNKPSTSTTVYPTAGLVPTVPCNSLPTYPPMQLQHKNKLKPGPSVSRQLQKSSDDCFSQCSGWTQATRDAPLNELDQLQADLDSLSATVVQPVATLLVQPTVTRLGKCSRSGASCALGNYSGNTSLNSAVNQLPPSLCSIQMPGQSASCSLRNSSASSSAFAPYSSTSCSSTNTSAVKRIQPLMEAQLGCPQLAPSSTSSVSSLQDRTTRPLMSIPVSRPSSAFQPITLVAPVRPRRVNTPNFSVSQLTVKSTFDKLFPSNPVPYNRPVLPPCSPSIDSGPSISDVQSLDDSQHGLLDGHVTDVSTAIAEMAEEAMDTTGSSSGCKVLAVVDTNVFIHDLELIVSLKDQYFPYIGHPYLVVPYVVTQELDKLKSNSRVGALAQLAIIRLNREYQSGQKRVLPQNYAQDQMKLPGICDDTNDDRIVKCGCQLRKWFPSHQVVTVSNDVNLRNKSFQQALPSYPARKFVPWLIAFSNAGGARVEGESNHFSVLQQDESSAFAPIRSASPRRCTSPLLGSPVSSDHTSSAVSSENWDTPYFRSISPPPRPEPSGSFPFARPPPRGQRRTSQSTPVQSGSPPAVESCVVNHPLSTVPVLCTLCVGYLTSVLQLALWDEMFKVYGDMWEDIVIIKPPWTFDETLQCVMKHWMAVFGFAWDKHKAQLKESISSLQKVSKENDSIAKIKSFCQLGCDIFEKIGPLYNKDVVLTATQGLNNVKMLTDELQKGSLQGQSVETLMKTYGLTVVPCPVSRSQTAVSPATSELPEFAKFQMIQAPVCGDYQSAVSPQSGDNQSHSFSQPQSHSFSQPQDASCVGFQSPEIVPYEAVFGCPLQNLVPMPSLAQSQSGDVDAQMTDVHTVLQVVWKVMDKTLTAVTTALPSYTAQTETIVYLAHLGLCVRRLKEGLELCLQTNCVEDIEQNTAVLVQCVSLTGLLLPEPCRLVCEEELGLSDLPSIPLQCMWTFLDTNRPLLEAAHQQLSDMLEQLNNLVPMLSPEEVQQLQEIYTSRL